MGSELASSEHLVGFAQIAIALAGFSSLIGLLGARSGRSHPRLDAARLQIMLDASLFVAFFSLLPLVPIKFGMESGLGWRVSAIAFLISDGCVSYLESRRWRVVSTFFERSDRILLFIVALLSGGADVFLLPVAVG